MLSKSFRPIRFICAAAFFAITPVAYANESDAKPTNCLIIVLDALRADFVSAYGYPQVTTPYIDSLAAEGVLFEQAYSQETVTDQSVASYMTGTYPQFLDSQTQYPGIPEEETSLAEMFQAKGYRTALFSTNPFIRENMGYFQGFESAANIKHRKRASGSANAAEDDYFRDSESTNRLVGSFKDWLSTASKENWFCYLHILRPHNPYVTNENYVRQFVQIPGVSNTELIPHAKRVENAFRLSIRPLLLSGWAQDPQIDARTVDIVKQLYGANLNHADDVVKELLEAVRSTGNLDDTLVVIMSDHGESFGEHKRFLHAAEPHEELVHVPLIMAGLPDDGKAGRRVETPVELVDLTPTLADIFELDAPPNMDGQSMLPLMAGEQTDAKPFYYAQAVRTNSIMVRSGHMKLIGTIPRTSRPDHRTMPKWELYNLADDPNEQQNLSTAPEYSETFDRLKQELMAYYAEAMLGGKSAEEAARTEEQEEQLRSLGYIE